MYLTEASDRPDPEAVSKMHMHAKPSIETADMTLSRESDNSTTNISSSAHPSSSLKSSIDLEQRNDYSWSSEDDNESDIPTILSDLFVTNLGDLSETRKLTLVKAGTKYHTDCTDYHQVQNPFPVMALTAILQQAKSLVCLELCRVRLSGSLEDFVQLANAIENQGQLLAFSMEHCRLTPSAAKLNAMEPVVRALASSPRIGDVTLMANAKWSMGTLSKDLVAFLGRSPSLRALRLHKMGLYDDQVIALSKALQDNQSLAILKLSCTIHDSGSTALAKMIRRNDAIEKLDIFLDKVVQEDCSVQIAQALQTSTTLKHYELDFGNKNMSRRLNQVYNDLVEHKALAQELEWSTSNTSSCPFLKMIRSLLGTCAEGAGMPLSHHIHCQQ